MIGYLEAHAGSFNAPVRVGRPALAVWRDGTAFVVETATESLAADAVVVASGAFGRPRVPWRPA